jgi:hypothetical protein
MQVAIFLLPTNYQLPTIIYCASEIRTCTPARVLVVGAEVLMYGMLRI